MTSPSLQYKIQSTRIRAPYEVEKARKCAALILAIAKGEPSEKALADLKSVAGSNWSPVHAMQFMSGRRGLFAAEAAATDEQPMLFFAILVAQELSRAGSINAPTLLALEVEGKQRADAIASSHDT